MSGLGRSADNDWHKIARTPGFAFHEWSLDEEREAEDLELVELVNPASWIDRAELEARRNSPSMTPWAWKRFTCGLWVAGEESAISHAWAADGGGTDIPDGTAGVLIGIDLGWRHDCTSLVPIVGIDPAKVGIPRILVPPGDDSGVLDAEQIFAEVEVMIGRFPGAAIVIRPGGRRRAAEPTDRAGPRGRGDLPQPNLDADVPGGAAAQRGDQRPPPPPSRRSGPHRSRPGRRGAAGGGVWKFVKRRRTDRTIDACIALAMAHSMLLSRAQEAAPKAWVIVV